MRREVAGIAVWAAVVACDSAPPHAAVRAEIAALPASRIQDVAPLAATIDDPLVRSMAVSSWVEAHATDAPERDLLALCDTLQGLDARACARPLTTPHLRP